MDNYFHIHVPIFGVEQIYGWKNDKGIGLLKKKIDKLARFGRTVVVRVGEDVQEYTISAAKVKEYPIHVIKKTYHKAGTTIYTVKKTPVYVVKKSKLNPRKPKTEEELAKEQYLKSIGKI